MARNGKKEAEILVVGTGAAGLLSALALADAGFAVVLIGPEPRLDDRRTTALMSPALGLLDRVGVLSLVERVSAPLKVMRIVDATSRLVRSAPVTFHASEIGQDAFGLNIPNSDLLKAATSAVVANAAIEWRKTTVERWQAGEGDATADLAEGGQISAKLVVAADGRMSPARDAAGIKTAARDYPQSALVLNFSHSRDHGFISNEFHTETGPFTQVPMPGKMSSLVWVQTPARAAELSRLDDQTLSALVEEKMQSMLGRVAVEPGLQVYPLSTLLPDRFAANRVALIGEAAHVFPPIGAQGLNLGIRDIEDIVSVAARHRSDPGAPAALRAYDLKRRPDVLARSTAVNLLNRSLLSDFLPAQMARGAGLGLLSTIARLRGFFMREGMQPGSGIARIFTALAHRPENRSRFSESTMRKFNDS